MPFDMSKQTQKLFVSFLFVVGVIVAGYNYWADKAYSNLTADAELAAFPLYHPIRIYGYLIESRIVSDSANPIQEAATVANIIHGQIIFGVSLMFVALILWVWIAAAPRVRTLDL